MSIFGKQISSEDLLRRCNPSALYGARRVTVADGKGKGQGLIEIKTTAGLRVTLLEDKGLDILDVEYKGVNLGFLSKNGLTNQNHTEADSFLRYWQGGFLGTCGLRNVGEPCTVDGEFFPFHGRIGLAAADFVKIDVNEKRIAITGTMRESALFGYCLEMERTIEIPSDGANISVKDVVKNLTPEAQPIFLLYHINFGFPFLSEDLTVKFPEGEIKGRTPEAQAALERHNMFTTPEDGIKEHVYFHLPKHDKPVVTLSNKQLGVTAEVIYDKKQLPILAEWHCMRSGDYALGIEPTSSFIRGRGQELANGYDVAVPGFGTLEFGFDLKVTEAK